MKIKIVNIIMILLLFFGTATTGYSIDMPSPECPGDPDTPCLKCNLKYACLPIPGTPFCAPWFYIDCEPEG